MDISVFTSMLATSVENGFAWSMIYQVFVFIISVILLSKSSHIVIKNSVKMAEMTKMGELVIGFLVLSVATSLPELAVSFSAIISGNVGTSIGNILGSNVANLGLVLAIPAIMSPMYIKREEFRKLPLILFFCSIIPLMLLVVDEMSVYTGGLLVLSFGFFAMYSMNRKITFDIRPKMPKNLLKNILMPFSFYKTVGILALGLLGVIISSTFVVSSTSTISTSLGIAESVVGATIIAIGTSLPELSVSLTAIKTKHDKMAIGNTIGSCLTNITLILGVVLLLSPATVNAKIFSTLLFFVIGITMIVWYFLTSEQKLDRREGVILLFIYILFLISTFTVQISII